MIELSNITVSFGDKTVLNDFSLCLPDEGCVAVQGPSGTGKTTLLRVLAGLIVPDAGSVMGLENRRVSMVFQEDRLLPWRSAWENAALGSDKDTARRFLAALGLGGECDSLPKSLSGGMRRRVAIARALSFSNDVLLLDEPFTGLDPALREETAALLRGHARLMILVTHDPQEAALLKAETFVRL